MGIAVTVTADSSLNGSRSKQVKFSVPSDQEVNILFLRYQVMQELVKAVTDLRSTLYVSMPEKADSVNVHHRYAPHIARVDFKTVSLSIIPKYCC